MKLNQLKILIREQIKINNYIKDNFPPITNYNLMLIWDGNYPEKIKFLKKFPIFKNKSNISWYKLDTISQNQIADDIYGNLKIIIPIEIKNKLKNYKNEKWSNGKNDKLYAERYINGWNNESNGGNSLNYKGEDGFIDNYNSKTNIMRWRNEDGNRKLQGKPEDFGFININNKIYPIGLEPI